MEHRGQQYKFVVAGGGGVYDFVYRDIDRLKYAVLDRELSLPKPARLARRVHLSRQINRVFPLPFRGVWGKLRVRQWAQKLEAMGLPERTPCFILFADMIPFERFGLSREIRKKFPQAKIVYFFQDLVMHDENKRELIQNTVADRIVTYDRGDAERYHLAYHNVPYSRLREEYPVQQEEYDVCFVGKAKERLPQILEAYRYLSAQGLRCDFYVTEAPEEGRQYADRIHYCAPMPYSDLLQKVARSRCILEIVQQGSSGNTLRINEAVEFNKMVITNNTCLHQNELYDPRYMFSYSRIQDLDCKALQQVKEVQYKTRDLLSVEKFLEDIAALLGP